MKTKKEVKLILRLKTLLALHASDSKKVKSLTTQLENLTA